MGFRDPKAHPECSESVTKDLTDFKSLLVKVSNLFIAYKQLSNSIRTHSIFGHAVAIGWQFTI